MRDQTVEEEANYLGTYLIVYRAVRNALDNALEHSPSKTPVEVSIDGCVVKVRDYDKVLPEDLRSKIFNMLHRISERAAVKSGAGLGLSIVTKTMEVHGGRAGLEVVGDGGGFSYWISRRWTALHLLLRRKVAVMQAMLS